MLLDDHPDHPRSFLLTQSPNSRPEERFETAQSSTMNQQQFIQKTALITGGCGGLGRAIAEAFLRAGTNVVVCDINEELMSDFKEKVSSAYPECTLVLQADITKDDRVDEVFTEGEKMFGQIDFVVNSAGRIDRFDAVAEMELSMWNKVIALNLTAPAVVSGRAIKKWLETGRKGVIVNIASTAGFRGFNCGASPTCPSGRRCTH
jgi:NAD(P)-dependent dehydrogenase (short-subunit alcohol dehydrogenase family)